MISQGTIIVSCPDPIVDFLTMEVVIQDIYNNSSGDFVQVRLIGMLLYVIALLQLANGR